jgi:hypothetical protein
MWESQLIELLSRFTTGELGISEFRDTIDERLFDLRMSPAMSPEKELLSKIQLYLHEIDEGLREKFEVYMLARSILDQCLTLLRKVETKHYPSTPPASRLGTSTLEPSREKIPAIV